MMTSPDLLRLNDSSDHTGTIWHFLNMQRLTVLPTEQNKLSSPDSLAKQVYFGLLQEKPDEASVRDAQTFLKQQLEHASHCSTDLPFTPEQLPDWMRIHQQRVIAQYQEYLQQRRAGAGRRYFSSRSHALYFLKGVAPTKLVDGAWLYGLLAHWRDARFTSLIRTYLEELGNGIPEKNHVVIYRKLLEKHGCEDWQNLQDCYYLQGAIQLALASHASDFLPEVIGFNLGYEQLPLHLLITAYELNELGIDPYYFTLHVTVDNAASGHACKALNAVTEALPRVADRSAFWRRVINGCQLNELGKSTPQVIAEFDLSQEVLAILAAKSRIGAALHSDYCRIAGRTVSEWLADPAQMPAFLDSLQQAGWIRRHQDPANSRFWKLIEGEQAEMFGVFTNYERQVIHDWIAGESMDQQPPPLSYKARQRLLGPLGQQRARTCQFRPRGLIRQHPQHDPDSLEPENRVNSELRLFEQKIARLPGKDTALDVLAAFLSPVHHHSAVGLMATRLFTQLL